MKIDEKLEFAVFDCETTGIDPEKDRIVEIAIVDANIESGIGSASEWLFSPGFPIPASASAIHHIIDQDVEGKPLFRSMPEEWPFSDYSVLVAHNAEFDVAFTRTSKPTICTMRLAQKLWPDLESYGNQYLRYWLKLTVPIQRDAPMHRALPDATVTACLLIRELKEVIARSKHPESLEVEPLIKWISEPMLLVTVRFGKHKGLKWADLPKDYLRWIVKSMTDADRDTIHTAKYYLN